MPLAMWCPLDITEVQLQKHVLHPPRLPQSSSLVRCSVVWWTSRCYLSVEPVSQRCHKQRKPTRARQLKEICYSNTVFQTPLPASKGSSRPAHSKARIEQPAASACYSHDRQIVPTVTAAGTGSWWRVCRVHSAGLRTHVAAQECCGGAVAAAAAGAVKSSHGPRRGRLVEAPAPGVRDDPARLAAAVGVGGGPLDVRGLGRVSAVLCTCSPQLRQPQKRAPTVSQTVLTIEVLLSRALHANIVFSSGQIFCCGQIRMHFVFCTRSWLCPCSLELLPFNDDPPPLSARVDRRAGEVACERPKRADRHCELMRWMATSADSVSVCSATIREAPKHDSSAVRHCGADGSASTNTNFETVVPQFASEAERQVDALQRAAGAFAYLCLQVETCVHAQEAESLQFAGEHALLSEAPCPSRQCNSHMYYNAGRVRCAADVHLGSSAAGCGRLVGHCICHHRPP